MLLFLLCSFVYELIKALSIDNNHGKAIFRRGQALLRLKQFEAAKRGKSNIVST